MRSLPSLAFVPPLLLLLIRHGTDLTSNSVLFDIAMVVSLAVLASTAGLQALLRLAPGLRPRDVEWLRGVVARLAWPTVLFGAVSAGLVADVLLAHARSTEQTMEVTRVPCRSTSQTAQVSVERAEVGGTRCFRAVDGNTGTVLHLDASRRRGAELPFQRSAWIRLRISNSLLFGGNTYFFAPELQ